MTVPVWVAELAGWFWERAGPPPPFPRELRGQVARSLLGSTVFLPGLTVGRVIEWLSDVGIAPPHLLGPGRPLRGLLFARDGEGLLFVAADDDPAERRFTLAHELAHLLRDYLQPRLRASAALGPAVLDVLDGRRLPTPTEQINAVLRDVSCGAFTHLMTRDDSRRTFATTSAEHDADRLACELIAPAAEVRARVGESAGAEVAVLVLTEEFGLPPVIAADYAAELFPDMLEDPLLDRLTRIFAARRRTSS